MNLKVMGPEGASKFLIYRGRISEALQDGYVWLGPTF